MRAVGAGRRPGDESRLMTGSIPIIGIVPLCLALGVKPYDMSCRALERLTTPVLADARCLRTGAILRYTS